ncbi:MAG: cardiolipin synthase [Phycisphaerales bacterium]
MFYSIVMVIYGVNIFLALHLLAVIATVVRILTRENFSPVTRLAWFMVIVVMPIFGVIVYFLFGDVTLGRTINKRHRSVLEHIQSLDLPFLSDSLPLNGIIAREYQPAFRYATSINGFGTTIGNCAQLMPDAHTTRSRLIEDIDQAQSSVNVLYYIWLNDQTGIDIANALIRAAKRGVVCRAMVDGLGSRAFIKSPIWKQMKAAGVQCSIALPFHRVIKTVVWSRLDLRNHRKITVIDAKITYCGSQNCADPEFRVKAKYAPWVDIMLRFEGPVVEQNQLLFASDWLLEEDDQLDDFEFDPQPVPDGVPAQVWGDGPTERNGATPEMFATLMAQAQSSLTISTPYFIPDDVVLGALCACANRGVATTIIFPARIDSWIVSAASRSFYRTLLEAGVQVYEFTGGLLHAKTLTIDNQITLIGSSNLDIRSFDLNYENNILLSDERITTEIRSRQQEYINSARQITLEQVEQWSVLRRIWNNVIATVGPIL